MTNYNMSNAGLQTTVHISMLITAFAGIALYNVVEILVLIFFTFKKRRGLYFWSLLVSGIAIIPYTLGLLFKFFLAYPLALNEFIATLIILGWCFMVTGQSVVLYSRLHLLMSSRKARRVLWMIICNFFVSNIPIAILVYGANSSNPDPWLPTYGIWERLQLCLYFTQETIISGLYVYEVFKLRRSMRTTSSASWNSGMETKRKVMSHLIYINILIIMIDVSLLVTEFIGHYEIQVLYKGAVYSIKLKLEFRILNQIVEVAQQTRRQSQAVFDSDSSSSAPSFFYNSFDNRSQRQPKASPGVLTPVNEEAGPLCPAQPEASSTETLDVVSDMSVPTPPSRLRYGRSVNFSSEPSVRQTVTFTGQDDDYISPRGSIAPTTDDNSPKRISFSLPEAIPRQSRRDSSQRSERKNSVVSTSSSHRSSNEGYRRNISLSTVQNVVQGRENHHTTIHGATPIHIDWPHGQSRGKESENVYGQEKAHCPNVDEHAPPPK
jgi:hypothetical protein